MYKMTTAQMTDEQINARVVAAREEMLTVAQEAIESEFHQGEKLVRAAQAVASAEAIASAEYTFVRVLANGADRTKQVEYLMTVLSRGADDEWSGRGNDSKRASFDAVRRWASDQFDHIKYGDQQGSN